MKDLVSFINENVETKIADIMEAYKTEDYKHKCFYISFSVDEGVLSGNKHIQPIMYMDITTGMSLHPDGTYSIKTFKNYKGLQKFLKDVIDDTWVEEKEEKIDQHTKEKYTVYTYKRVDYPNYEELMKQLD